MARIRVVTRRKSSHLTSVLKVGDLEMDTASHTVSRAGKQISLTNKEYNLLLLFARNPGAALYRETIYERVWGGDYNEGSRTVDLHIQRLRRKVGWEDRLVSVHKVGYRLEADS